MRRMLLATVAAMAGACGSGSGPDGGTGDTVDHAPAFVATWSGTITVTDPTTGALIASSQQLLPIIEASANVLTLQGLCIDGSGPNVNVTSATTFALLASHVCPPDTTETSCPSIVLTYTSLTGTLSGTTLAVTGSVTATGCSATVSENISFASGPGTKK